MTDKMNWIDEVEAKNEKNSMYFTVKEGENKFVLLSHCAPLSQVWDNTAKRYRVAGDDDQNISIRGVCWVLQDDAIKQAKLPYVVVKQIRALNDEPDWDFQIPFPHMFTLKAKGAGTKEVEYSLTPSPKKIEIPQIVLDELAKKPSPEEVVELIKSKSVSPAKSDYPTAESEGIDLDASPF